MRYSAIVKDDKDEKRHEARIARQLHLYSKLWLDLAAIIKALLPSDKVVVVGNHVKSIIFIIAELKTGKKPDKL